MFSRAALATAVCRTLFCSALLAVALPAQTSKPSSDDPDVLQEQAVAAWEHQDWPAAAAALAALAPLKPEDGQMWYRLGYALHAQGKIKEALPAHTQAAAHGQAQLGSYNAACAYALLGESERAFEWLQKAVDAGFTRAGTAKADPDLTSLREDPRFATLLEAMFSTESDRRRLVAVFVHDGVELLDFAGPGEVFAQGRGPKGESFRVVTVAPTREPILSQGFLTVVPEFDFASCPQPDVLVIPGGSSQRALADPTLVPWVQRVAPKAEIVMSICTGAFILARAGLLDGKEATTFFGALGRLENRYPKVSVRRDLRVVEDGKIVTTAGISAGIDGSLHVVERLLGQEAAELCARGMEYDWRRSNYRGGR
ncbi:MAG: DJ-1/PfpI family protein [Planctomycetota bacterium]